MHACARALSRLRRGAPLPSLTRPRTLRFAAQLLAYVLDVVSAHDASTPLFLMLSTHSIHEPYEVPNFYLNKFSFVDIEVRQYYVAMVNHIDDVVGNLTAALKAKGMWANTLFVSTSDNGGPLAKGDISGLVDTSGAKWVRVRSRLRNVSSLSLVPRLRAHVCARAHSHAHPPSRHRAATGR